MGDREDEERERNDEWFYRQRAYPFGEIPPDARRTAWEQTHRSAILAPGARAPRPVSGKAAATTRFWRSIGPTPTDSAIGAISPVSGRVRAIAVSPVDPNIVLVGAAGGGIWRSADGGATFAPVSDDQVDLAVGAIRFAPSSPSTVYAAMGQEYLGSGVLASTDAGLTWRRVSDDSLPTPGLASDLEVDPRDAKRLYLAQYAGLGDDGNVRASGAYLSTDGGRTWRRTLAGLAKDVAVDADDPRVVYLTMTRVDEAGSPPPGIYRSTDGGQTWTHEFVGPFKTDAYPAFSLATGQGRVLAFASGVVNLTTTSRVFASADQGKTWSPVSGQGLPSSEASFLVASPADPLYAFVGFPGGDTFKTVDGGATWACVTIGYCDGRFGRDDRTHVDQHALAISPADSNRVFMGNDGGVYTSADGGATWSSLNQTLSLVTFRTVAISPSDPALSVGGTQDNGSQRRLPGGALWQEIITGDGGGVVFDRSVAGAFYTTYIYGTVFRWSAEGYDGRVADERSFGESTAAPRIAFYPPFVGDGATPRLYFGTWRLFVSDDRGETWSAPSGPLDLTKGGDDVLSAIGVGPASADVIYTGSSQGRVMVSVDAGRTWRDATAGLPNRFVSSITVDRADPSVAWLTVSGFRSGHVFKTTDAGRRFTDVSAELPDIPANALLQDPFDPTVLYLGTDIGVFRSTSEGRSWESFSDGMPPALAIAFASHPSGVVQVATYGRGIYELGDSGANPDYSVALAHDSVEVARGAKVMVDGDVVRASGFSESVTLAAPDTRDLGLKVKVSRLAPDGSFTVTVKAKRSAAPGTYPIGITGKSTSGVLRTGTLAVTVR